MSHIIKRSVEIQGYTPIMFDRYSGSNEDQLTWREKLYLSTSGENGGRTLVFPALNWMSFLSSQGTDSAPKKLMGKKWKSVASACMTYVTILPMEIPFICDGKPIRNEDAKISRHECVARVKKGSLSVPNPKERPVLDVPWGMVFEITLIESKELTENMLKQLFELGGLQVGIGTYRPQFGKFYISRWE